MAALVLFSSLFCALHIASGHGAELTASRLTSPLVLVSSGSQNGTTVPDALRWFCAEARSHHLVATNVKLSAVSGSYPLIITVGNYILQYPPVVIVT
jgi:hypothetical protein